MIIRSALTYPFRVALNLAFVIANRWLTTELDNPFLWPHVAEFEKDLLAEDVSIDGTHGVS